MMDKKNKEKKVTPVNENLIIDDSSCYVKNFNKEYEIFANSSDSKRLEAGIKAAIVVATEFDFTNENIKDKKSEYTHIDYYLAYKDLYKFEDLYQSCNHADLDIKTLKSFLSTAELRNSLNYESFRNQYYCVYNHEFNDEEKEEIYNFAKENKIPFNWKNVSLIVAKYYKDQAKKLNKAA